MVTKGRSDSPGHRVPSQACVVYDKRDARIAHIHEFVPATAGGSCSLDALHSAAMDMASRLCGTEFLAIADAPDELVRGPRKAWRVDLSTGELKTDLEMNTEEKHERRRQD